MLTAFTSLMMSQSAAGAKLRPCPAVNGYGAGPSLLGMRANSTALTPLSQPCGFSRLQAVSCFFYGFTLWALSGPHQGASCRLRLCPRTAHVDVNIRAGDFSARAAVISYNFGLLPNICRRGVLVLPKLGRPGFLRLCTAPSR